MATQEYMDKMQLRQNYRNLWHSDLMRCSYGKTSKKDNHPMLSLNLLHLGSMQSLDIKTTMVQERGSYKTYSTAIIGWMSSQFTYISYGRVIDEDISGS
ncbi:hypothetical protein HPP92_012742 [Vanilla planifolia]|uniref:Uncharacterized protein n=1 Tax=Vanilla planifolia TaxID=51239 RepID=A0A835UXZ0_VANPL|nr:hypothetical protein HPP92_012742 [Vanilla planifolia]